MAGGAAASPIYIRHLSVAVCFGATFTAVVVLTETAMNSEPGKEYDKYHTSNRGEYERITPWIFKAFDMGDAEKYITLKNCHFANIRGDSNIEAWDNTANQSIYVINNGHYFR